MKWPIVNAKDSFDETESRLGITKEMDDIRAKSLGAHPSASFYTQKEPTINLQQMRAHFDRVAKHY